MSTEVLDAAPPTSRPGPLRRTLAVVGSLVLGGLFVVAAWSKLLDPEGFTEVVAAEGLDVVVPARIVALGAIGLEVGLGLALLLGLRNRFVLGASTALVVGFLFLTGRAYVRHLTGQDGGEPHSCGCFGNLVDRSPEEAFWQDVLLLVPAIVAAWLVPSRAPRARAVRGWITVVATAGAVAFAVAAPELPLDDLATRLRPGLAVRDLCTQTAGDPVCLARVVPPLADAGSRHVVILADLDAPTFRAAIPDLNGYAADGVGPTLWVLSTADKATIERFRLMAGASFAVMPSPKLLVRSMYRRLPRSFLVEDGRVVRTWEGLPPLRSLASPPPG